MEKIISYIRDNLEMIKKIMFPAVVIMSMIVFWIFGGEEDLTVDPLHFLPLKWYHLHI